MAKFRAPRVDAVRNRCNILGAARDQITLRGPAAGMDAIAAAAGVAVGTVYRQFPTKADLVEAVVAEYVGEVADLAESSWAGLQNGGSALSAIAGFLHRVTEASAANSAVKAAADALGADLNDTGAEARANEALRKLIGAGQSTTEIHPDVSVSDVHLLLSAAPIDGPPDVRARWLTLVLPGLTTRDRTAFS